MGFRCYHFLLFSFSLCLFFCLSYMKIIHLLCIIGGQHWQLIKALWQPPVGSYNWCLYAFCVSILYLLTGNKFFFLYRASPRHTPSYTKSIMSYLIVCLCSNSDVLRAVRHRGRCDRWSVIVRQRSPVAVHALRQPLCHQLRRVVA